MERYGRNGERKLVKCLLGSLFATEIEKNVTVCRGDEGYLARVKNFEISLETVLMLQEQVKVIGVTENFRKVIDCFSREEKNTPAGFRIELVMESPASIKVDLVRDISYDRNGLKRPTDLLFSADSANPYEIKPIKDLIANLTCNPGIIYDLFINNPKANVGNAFKTRDEVMEEIGRILGPGVDISVELNDPFGKTEAEILEEAARFKEMLSEYRVVIKVPHTGPVNAANVGELLTGDKKFSKRYNNVSTADALRGHNLALLLREHGYRVNFTLMFEPYQTALALQARPYFINSFIRHRFMQSVAIKQLLELYAASGDVKYLESLRTFLVDKDYLAAGETGLDLFTVRNMAERILQYRSIGSKDGCDGLDAVRHNLRLLRNVNMADTRLIICSMEGDKNYPDIDKLLAEDEFTDLIGRVVLTAEPNYLAQFTSCNQVISYQRRFMNAASGKQ